MKFVYKVNGCIFGDHQRLFKMRLLSNETGWVEGILESLDQQTDEEPRFVFGVFYPNKVIELFELPLIDNDVTLNFHIEKECIDYKGHVLDMRKTDKELYGLCSLIIRDAEDKLDDEENLENRIREVKNKMDLYGKSFYYDAIKNQERILNVVADSYQVRFDIKELLKKL